MAYNLYFYFTSWPTSEHRLRVYSATESFTLSEKILAQKILPAAFELLQIVKLFK